MKALGAKASTIVTKAFLAGWRTAVNSTPRDTGTAQAGWKLSNKRIATYIPVRRKQPRPLQPPFRFRITKDTSAYLWNNVPYVPHLNDGNPPGRPAYKMLQKAVATINAKMEELRRI